MVSVLKKMNLCMVFFGGLLLDSSVDDDDCFSDGFSVFVLFLVVGAVVDVEVCCSVGSF